MIPSINTLDLIRARPELVKGVDAVGEDVASLASGIVVYSWLMGAVGDYYSILRRPPYKVLSGLVFSFLVYDGAYYTLTNSLAGWIDDLAQNLQEARSRETRVVYSRILLYFDSLGLTLVFDDYRRFGINGTLVLERKT